jgi:hypothetical protein
MFAKEKRLANYSFSLSTATAGFAAGLGPVFQHVPQSLGNFKNSTGWRECSARMLGVRA